MILSGLLCVPSVTVRIDTILTIRYRFTSAVTKVSLSFYSAVYAVNEWTVYLGFIILLIAAVVHFENVCQEFSTCSTFIFIVIQCHSVWWKIISSIRKHALLMSRVFDSTSHCEQLFSLMKKQISYYWWTLGGMHADCNDRNKTWHWKITQAKAVSNISLVPNFVRDNYWVTGPCEPVCTSRPNLVTFLIHCMVFQ
jgi:hypothetical protein